MPDLPPIHQLMTKVAILPEHSAQGAVEYRAMAGGCEALAGTAGAALDALTAQLPSDQTGTLVIVQSHASDEFFSARQQQRLSELMALWRTARDARAGLDPLEQAELDALVEAELRASGQRTSAVLAELAK